jgi:hypothetical protein
MAFVRIPSAPMPGSCIRDVWMYLVVDWCTTTQSETMNTMTAYCGLACDTCPIYLATLEPDRSRRLSMRSDIALKCNEQYGMNLHADDVNDCDGCRAGARLFAGCINCEIRSCATERQVLSCAFCPDYGCERIEAHFKADESARTRLEALRSAR